MPFLIGKRLLIAFFCIKSSLIFSELPLKKPLPLSFDKKLSIGNHPLIPPSLQTFLACVETININSSYEELVTVYSQLVTLKQRNLDQTGSNHDQTIYDQAELLVVITICKKEAYQLVSHLITILTELFDQLTYWQQVKLHPTTYYITHLPNKIINKKKCLQIAERAIETLKEAIYYYSYYLGHIHHNIYALENIKNETSIKDNLSETAALIKACINHHSINDEKTLTLSLIEIHDTLTACHQAVVDFHTQCLSTLQEFKKPTHLERNWLLYSIGAITLIASTAYTSMRHEKIVQNVLSAYGGVQKLFRENLIQPISSVIQEYTSKQQSANNQLKDYLKNQEDQLVYIFTDFLKDKAKKQHISDDQLQYEIKKMIETGDYYMVKDEIKDFLNKPAYALNPYSKSSQISAIWLLQSVRTAAKVISSIQDQVNQQQVNLQLLLTIPASAFFIGTYVTYRIIKNITQKLTHTTYNPLREGLVSIENTLNANNKNNVPLSYEAQGLIIYWLSKLRFYLPYLTRSHQEQFDQDLAQIGSPEFTIQQKLATIDRMYRTYKFLSFGFSKHIHTNDQTSFFRLSLNPEPHFF